MLLRFKIDNEGFRCLDSEIASTAISINYIKCHFDVRGTEWEDVDAICAIFKSATYNKYYEVMLDSNNNCFIDPEIYRRGGTIQVKLAGDKYIDESVVSSTSITPVVEFQIRDNVIIPTPTPSKYDVFVAEIEIARDAVDAAILDLAQRVASGEFNGKDGANITNITYNSDGTVTIDLSDGQQFTSVQSMKGEKGDRGDDGIGIASVVYGEDGSLVITMSDGTQYISPYSIKGEKGDKGDPGDKGDAFVYEDFTQEELDDLAEAATPRFQIGIVSTLAPGSQATATITGDPQNPSLNLGIPRGDTGATGPQGPKGDSYVLTTADREEIRDAVYALIQAAEGSNY